jgi:hypothetical protein
VEDLKAIFITYAIKEHTTRDGKHYGVGDVVNVEMKIKGFAPKVADRQRDDWQSVLRCSMKNSVKSPLITTISAAKIVDRRVVIGSKIILEEDVDSSLVYVPRIEDIEDVG